MRTWRRARRDQKCGGPCGQDIRAGDPILELHVSGLSRSRSLVRCAQCAGEAPPELLPDLKSEPVRPLDMTRIGLLSFAWQPPERKLVAAGREPGEDD